MITEISTIGIVGGGKVGLELFSLFSKSKLTKVVFVEDVNGSAPALVEAGKAGVKTYTDLASALQNPVDFIIEVTGLAQVVTEIQNRIDPARCQLITHGMAYIILQVIEENDHKVKGESIGQIQGIKDEIDNDLQKMTQMLQVARETATQMKLLALNARIEAARVGEVGKGFAVVASEMGKSSVKVIEVAEKIEQTNDAIKKTSSRIEDSLSQLK